MADNSSKVETGSPFVEQPLSTQERQVYVVDDDPRIRRSLHFMLSSEGYQCWTFSSASDFLAHLPDLVPSPILLDIRMEKISGMQLLTILADREIFWPVIMMTAHGDITTAVQTIKLGATDFLEKPFELHELTAILDTALASILQMQDLENVKHKTKRLFNLLTSREHEVISRLATGSPNKTVAFNLSLSTRTVEMHRSNALAKLHVKSIAEVITLASIGGIKLTPDPSC
jgi:two-component system response regulator FixJ